ncbi:phosphoenolpyruvate hydrolase family protein [Shimia sp.]|uniref:phosphoenolpyruvate hydrolase family protein n=1 Tax=Shimia sp. TaxID=1954381 RepID=UPI003BA8A124
MSTSEKPFLFAAVVGSGLTAKAADKAGADYLLALNAGRFRVQGASSLTSFLPVRSANDWVIEFAEREMLGRCDAPLTAGYSVSDPTLDIENLVSRTRDLGFSGICNFPSTTLLDGRISEVLEQEGLGFARELDLVRLASKAGLTSFAYVRTNQQARRMVDAGATAICVNVGFTSGATGVSTHLTLDTAARLIDRVLEGVPATVDKLCHGGPITSPEEALAVTRICRVEGFVAGSTLDRLPVEQTLNEVTRGFTAIPALARSSSSSESSGHDLVGSSHAMQNIRADLNDLAHADVPVLLVGETGTGKSRAALHLHESGPAARRQPVVVDCPALTSEDGATYLLGRGGGSSGSQRGALEQAAGSTVILDEVSALALDHQGKLIKFADERVVQRVGDHTLRDVSARIISTTCEQLDEIAETGAFRRDLFYRLSGHEVILPPLRERVDDIPELALHLGRKQTGMEPKFSNAALRALLEHPWPGNVRELGFAVQRAIRNANGGTIDLRAVEFLRSKPQTAPATPEEPALPATAKSEKEWIAEALARNGFRRGQTAAELGITTRTLYNKIKKHGLQT